MSEAISYYLPQAMGVMLSPMPIVAMTVLCILGLANSKGVAFLFGWATGITLLMVLTMYFSDSMGDTSGDGPSTWSTVLQLIFGALLLYLAYKNWATRPKDDEEVQAPSWVQSLSSMKTILVFGFGALLASVNLKNSVLIISSTLIIVENSSGASAWFDALIFIFLGSIGVAIPLLITIFGGENTKNALGNMRDWLYRNNNTIMMVLFLFLGVQTLSKALSAF